MDDEVEGENLGGEENGAGVREEIGVEVKE